MNRFLLCRWEEEPESEREVGEEEEGENEEGCPCGFELQWNFYSSTPCYVYSMCTRLRLYAHNTKVYLRLFSVWVVTLKSEPYPGPYVAIAGMIS